MSFIVTATGKRFYFERPEEFAFGVEDIAPALGNLCRFAGQAGWWSVAQHSMFVAELVAPEHQLRALLHDASEAFLVDVPGPLKNLPALAGYRAIEERVENAIFKTFGAAMDPDAVKAVKQADLIALRAEAKALGVLSPDWNVWGLPERDIPEGLWTMSRHDAGKMLTAAIIATTPSGHAVKARLDAVATARDSVKKATSERDAAMEVFHAAQRKMQAASMLLAELEGRLR